MHRQRSFPWRGRGRARRMAGGRQEAGSSLAGRHRSLGPGAGPGRPPRGEPAPSPQWEDGETWRRGFSGQAPRGIAAPSGSSEGHRVARGGTGRVGPPHLCCWPALGAAGQHLPCGQQGLGGTCSRWLGDPAGCRDPSVCWGPRLLPPALCHGVPTTGCNRRKRGAVRKKQGDPLLQRLLDGVRGPGPLNAARGHEQPSPKVACPSDPSRARREGGAAPSPRAGTFGLPVPVACGQHWPCAPGAPAGELWAGGGWTWQGGPCRAARGTVTGKRRRRRGPLRGGGGRSASSGGPGGGPLLHRAAGSLTPGCFDSGRGAVSRVFVFCS